MSKLFKNSIHPKLEEGITFMLCDLRHKMPFYGEFNLMINFQDGTKKGVDTCGVNVTRLGMNFYFNTEFLDKLPQKEVNFIIIHEDFHLLFNHPQRTVTGKFDPHLANIAQDMIINQIIWEDISHDVIDIPKYYGEDNKNNGKNMGLFIPEEYDGEPIFEHLYEWLKEKQREHRKRTKMMMKLKGKDKVHGDDSEGNGQGGDEQGENNKGDNQGDNQGDGQSNNDDNQSENKDGKDGNGFDEVDSAGNPSYGKYGKGGIETWSLDSMFDNMSKTEGQYMDSHIGDEVPAEVREAYAKEAVERLRARGLVQGNIETVLGKLRKKRKDWLREIKRSISNEIFGDTKVKSITRPNRRQLEGVKGKRKTKNKINVILDTSGSMGGLFEKVLSYVYSNDIEINLIQCDTQVNDVRTIKNKKKLEIIPIRGLGGTIIQPAVDLVSENFNMYNNVILTDGYTDTLNFLNIKGRTLIISTDNNCPTINDKRVRQIIVDDSHI